MQVYKITNKTNGKIYIGLTKVSLEQRMKWHLKIANNIKHYNKKKKAAPLQRAIAKYGIDNFTIETIEKCDTFYNCCNREIFWIDKLKATDKKVGYNICPGGQGIVHTDELKARKSKTMMKLRDAGKLHNSKITKEQALEIKNKIIEGKQTNRELASEYGVSFSLISAIQKNKIFKDVLKDTPVLEHGKDGWKHPGFKNRSGTKNNLSKFTEQQVLDIKKRHENGDMINTIAKDYGVWRQTISRIINKKSYT